MNDKKNSGIAPSLTQTSSEHDDDILIYSYTRSEAIADGVLIDVSKLAAETGFRYPVAMTAAAWHDAVAVPPDVDCQDETGRLWDVLFVLLLEICRGGKGSRVDFQVSVQQSNAKHRLVTLKSICGPGDHGEPVITIMLPDED